MNDTSPSKQRIAVLGAGAWGTALAATLAHAHDVVLWGRDAAQIITLAETRENRRYLPGIPLPAGLRFESDLTAALATADLCLIVTPLAALRATVRRVHAVTPDLPLLWACKGVEVDSGKLPHEIVAEELGNAVPSGVLTGPSFADEVGRGMPTALTLAARDLAFAEAWAQALHQPHLRIYAHDDPIGAEFGGGVKNVIAIAAGVSDGMGFGLNARAALITRGLAEITRLGQALGGRSETLMGLSGMGDLILTCTGDLSRNRRVGLALARGLTLPAILSELGHVAEGVPAARAVTRLARTHGIEMPICEAVDALLHSDTIGPKDAVERLLSRDPKREYPAHPAPPA
ncbi:MAG: NAD(P)H-dependent glycerol-3-phosphate dehydrogenase [Rhodocyclaceae bacterium]